MCCWQEIWMNLALATLMTSSVDNLLSGTIVQGFKCSKAWLFLFFFVPTLQLGPLAFFSGEVFNGLQFVICYFLKNTASFLQNQ
jgi:hypothetical protein